jgi:hypothetical protein
MLALATKITQADYDQARLTRNDYSPQISMMIHSCLVVEPTKRPDIVAVASMIAERVLTFTDAVRYKCLSLEKKLEKEKNRTQKWVPLARWRTFSYVLLTPPFGLQTVLQQTRHEQLVEQFQRCQVIQAS